MAVLNGAVTHRTQATGLEQYKVAQVAETIIYSGALVGLEADLATSADADEGRIKPWADDANLTFIGIAVITDYDEANEDFRVTNSSSVVGEVFCPVDVSGRIIEAVSATETLTEANVGDHVYCETDNIADFKVDDGLAANKNPIGRIIRVRAADSADIRLFNPEIANLKRGDTEGYT